MFFLETQRFSIKSLHYIFVIAETHNAIILSNFNKPLEVKKVPIPVSISGSVVVKVLALYLVDYMKNLLKGQLGYLLHFPMIPAAPALAAFIALDQTQPRSKKDNPP
jgi:hypothetical protein